MSIGEVLGQLRSDFPDVTISKIRFLESAGLVEPQRTPSGYRKFTHDDIQRLRYVLAAQRDQYLPLRVIKEHLEALDRGLEPPSRPGGRPSVPVSLVPNDQVPGPDSFSGRTGMRLSRPELLESSGLREEQLRELESFGLVAPRSGHYDADSLTIATTVCELAAFGLEARHLRAYKAAADREVGLVEQVVAPLRQRGSAESSGRAEEIVRELASLSVRLHAALVKAGLTGRA
jgi:DNA-binding transcriptional MerR regulator